MMVSNRGSTWRLLFWQWRNTAFFVTSAALVSAGHELLGWTWLTLPALPLAVVGGALGIFVSFRTNSAYDRWWEGRKLWGRLINTSRHWGSQVMAYVPGAQDGAPSAEQTRLVMRHVAYVHVLRCLLRKEDPFADEEVMTHLEGDIDLLKEESNLTHALLAMQLEEVAQLNQAGAVNGFRLSDFDESLRHLLDIQGGCERIKNTPMPRGYAFIAERLVQYFSILFPMTIVAQLHWAVIPINLLVCMAFALISEAGRVLEDPFSKFWNGLPLSNISRTIEVNLRQRLHQRRGDLPPLTSPDARGILM